MKEVEVRTKTPINSEIRKLITNKFGAKIKITEKIDSKMQGGIIVKTENTIFDGSLKNQLKKLKNKLYLIIN